MGVTDLIASLERIAPDAFWPHYVRTVGEDVAAFDGHGKLHQILNIGEQTLETLFLVNFREVIEWMALPARDPSVTRRGVFVMDHKDRITRRKEREHKSRAAAADAKLKRAHSQAAEGKLPAYTKFPENFRFLDPPSEGMPPPPTKIDRTKAPRFDQSAEYDRLTGTDWVRYYGPWIDAQPHAKRALLEYFEACVKESLVPPPGVVLTFDFAFGHAFHLHPDGRVEPCESAPHGEGELNMVHWVHRVLRATPAAPPRDVWLCTDDTDIVPLVAVSGLPRDGLRLWWRVKNRKPGERHVVAADLGHLYRVLQERYSMGAEQLVWLCALHGQDFAEKKNYTPGIGHETQLMYMLEAFASPRPPRTLQQLVGYVQWRCKEDGGVRKAKARSAETLVVASSDVPLTDALPSPPSKAQRTVVMTYVSSTPPTLNRARVPPRADLASAPLSTEAIDDAAFLLKYWRSAADDAPYVDEPRA